MSGQVYATGSLGGNFSLPYLTNVLRYTAQPLMRFRQMCDVKEAIGKGKGESFQWEVIANIASQGTTLNETDTVPSSNFTVTKGSCTITEYANSIPFTRKLKELSQFEIAEIIRKTLANDLAKALDQAVFDIAKTAKLVFQASGSTDTTNAVLYTDGTGTVANNATAWLHTGHIFSIVDQMKERNIPAFDGEDYVCIAHPSTLTNLRNQLVSVNQYTEIGYKKILNGEIGRFGGMRFVEQTNIGKVTATNAGAGSWAAIFGGEAITEAISVPEEIIEKEITDYGRSLGLAWYFMGGYGFSMPTATVANCRVALWWPNASVPANATYA